MAGVGAISSVTSSLLQGLEAAFEALTPAIVSGSVTFSALSSGDFAVDGTPPATTTVSLYLYRVSVNEHLRNARPQAGADRSRPLPINLHYLLTVWASSSATEQTLLAWAMRHLHSFPVLDRSLLNDEGAWASDEVIHIAPEELTNEDMLRLWDTLEPRYRLSYTYVARVININPDTASDGALVTGRSLQTERVAHPAGGAR